MRVRMGCCGWQYDDWIGPFYPPEMRNRKAEWLGYYGQYFDSVEIDSSYYSVPGQRTVQAWILKGKKIPSFEFSLKMHRGVTHESLVEGKVEEAVQRARDFEKGVCAPLADAGLLGAVLLQLSPLFPRYRRAEGPEVAPRAPSAPAGTSSARSIRPAREGTRGSNLPALRALLEGLDTDRYRHVAEFRHQTWLDGAKTELHPEALELLRERKVAACILDSPAFPATREQTADHAYLRFHGQNRDLWYGREKAEGDPRLNRYDYLYSDEELAPWVEQVDDMEERCREVRIAFNNHGHAKAVRNGLRFREMLGLETDRKGSIQPRKRLEDFG